MLGIGFVDKTYAKKHMQKKRIVYVDQRFACFVALRPKSTAMVMVGLSVRLTTLFPGQA